MRKYVTFERTQEYIAELYAMEIEFKITKYFNKMVVRYKITFINPDNNDIIKSLPDKFFSDEIDALKFLYDFSYAYLYLIKPYLGSESIEKGEKNYDTY